MNPTDPKNPHLSSPPIDPRTRTFERLISHLLRTGVVVSLTLIVTGTVMTFIHHPDYSTSAAPLAKLNDPNAAFPRSLHETWVSLRRLEGRALVIVGLLCLIATPVLRVAVSAMLFALERDRVFTLITLIVLLLLMISFAVGKAGAG